MLRRSLAGRVSRAGRIISLGPCALAVVLLGGCSADVGRFDLTSVGPGSSDRTHSAAAPTPTETVGRSGAGIPVESEQLGSRSYDGGRAPQPYGTAGRPAEREPAVRMSGLPEATSREPQGRAGPTPLRTSQPVAAAPTAAAPATGKAAGRVIPTSAGGETVEVQPGDTLYGISKKHRVPISELMSINNLQTPAIKPGQKLTLPAATGGRRTPAPRQVAAQPAAAPAPVAAPAPPAAAPTVREAAPRATTPAATPADWGGSHIVAQGESLYGIARSHKVKVPDLMAANGIADATKLRPGTVLKVPGQAAAPAAAVAPTPAAPAAAPAPAAGGPRPTIINAQQAGGETKVAALGAGTQPTQTDASAGPKAEPAAMVADPPKATAGAKFRWPVKGKVIAGFGPRPDNTHNDGINISVPLGTDVLAAENGVVAYAGNELKGYGNLVLVRHEGNWVSAYAHNEQLLVKRGDKIKRGQPIAKAGNSGAVDQPQVHFELRQGSKPVDPLPHMEKN